uniref:Opioid growth factor receptor (OGFr) conserved domain-containing protein n=1 Tax=Mola mola TaxID=94237 RepID=A0A3Q4BWE0_MOLML
MTDEFYCGYDSTWETEESQPKNARRQGGSRHVSRLFQLFTNSFLFDDFCFLSGVYIHNFHNRWAGDYNALEYVHTYIQWLFPLQEPGMNHEASPLTEDEVKCFLENVTAKKNLLESYKLMLDFYGIVLCDEETGKVKRASNWDERFQNLNNHTHNNLRITRILKCLGTLGYPHYQSPLVRFFLEETLVHGELPNIKDSVLNYFLFAVLDKRQRRSLIKFAYLNYDRKDEFVWCPKKIQMIILINYWLKIIINYHVYYQVINKSHSCPLSFTLYDYWQNIIQAIRL